MQVYEPTVSRGSDYSALLGRVRDAGLLDRRPVRAAIRIALMGVLFAAGWTGFVLLGESWWQLATAGFLAVVFTQLGFLGHDAGHRQLFRSRRLNDIVGLVSGNLGIGLSFGWWMNKHNRHHANPNHTEHDPDVSPGAIVFAAKHTRIRRGFARFFARNQAYLFFPLLTLEAIALHVASVQDLLSKRGLKQRLSETVLFGAHVAGYLTAVLLVLPPWQALVFVAVHQGLFGIYLGCSFAPNHKGMPMSSEQEMDFLRRQVLTSRNVRGGPVTDVALGGLNYQIEHHLFPNMPRSNLRHAQPVVRAFCAERGVSYLESSLVSSYAQALRHLHAVGRA